MKKIITLSLIVMLFLCTALGCTANNLNNNTNSIQQLSINKKYSCCQNSVDSKSCIEFTFKTDDSGEYYNYYQSSPISVTEYTIEFKYTIIEDTVVCFFDKIIAGSKHSPNISLPNNSSWTMTLGFSKDILLSTDNKIFINEDYMKNIPNFGK